MPSESDQIKQLLLADELALLQQLREKVLESDQFSQEVAKVLAQATQRAWKNDPAYQAALAKPIGQGLKTALKKEQRSIIDAFVPVIGPMIRASVSASIKKLMADINRVLELGLSPKAMKWRWQSWKTGVPFAELVFLNTVEYQVQHVFLIDKASGLLIEYVGHEEELARDKDAFSAMLTAIGDFVADTLSGDTANRLSSAELGEYQLWIIDGPKAYLAVLIKGSPSQRLREHLQDALDKIHFLYADELADSSQYGNLPALRLELEDLLVTQSRQQEDDTEEQKKKRLHPAWLLLLAALLLGGWGIWQHFQHQAEFRKLQDQLRRVPGFILQQLQPAQEGWLATGLKDPQADLSAFQDKSVRFQTRPFLSLDNPLVKKRLQNQLQGSGLSWQLADNGTLYLQGRLPHSRMDSLRQQLLAVPGVQAVDTTAVHSAAERWQAFLQANPVPAGLKADFANDRLSLRGQASEAGTREWLRRFQRQFPGTAIELDRLQWLPSVTILTSMLNKTFVPMPAGTAFNPEVIEPVATSIRQLLQQRPEARIVLTGSTDCTGGPAINRQLARQRAETVKQALVAKGIPPSALVLKTRPCLNNPASATNPARRGTRLSVQLPAIKPSESAP
jgi:hypothetical protein